MFSTSLNSNLWFWGRWMKYEVKVAKIKMTDSIWRLNTWKFCIFSARVRNLRVFDVILVKFAWCYYTCNYQMKLYCCFSAQVAGWRTIRHFEFYNLDLDLNSASSIYINIRKKFDYFRWNVYLIKMCSSRVDRFLYFLHKTYN